MENNVKIDRELAKRAKKIDELKEQITGLRQLLRDEEIAYNAQVDLVKLMNRAPSIPKKGGTVRPGTDLAKIHQMLCENNHPVHISEIAKFLGKEDTPAVRASLAGSLGSYAREKRIFAKIGKNTFGLIGKDYSEGVDDLV